MSFSSNENAKIDVCQYLKRYDYNECIPKKLDVTPKKNKMREN